MIDRELLQNIWKLFINRTDGNNNRQNKIPTIPFINNNIIIFQHTEALADGVIYSKGGGNILV